MNWYKKAVQLQDQGDLFQGYPTFDAEKKEGLKDISEDKISEYIGYTKQPGGYAEIYFDVYYENTKSWKRWAYLLDPDKAEKIANMARIKGIGNKPFSEALKWRKAEWQLDSSNNIIPGTLNENVNK